MFRSDSQYVQTVRFNRDAFLGLLTKELELCGEKPATWAKRVGISPGTLHDITSIRPGSDAPRRQPSASVIKKLADGLGVPVRAITDAPSIRASA